MAAQPDLTTAQARLDALLPDPRGKTLIELIQWVIANDSDYKGLEEREIFVKACGDPKEGLAKYKEACKTGDDVCVRTFCLARMHKLTKGILAQPLA